MNRILARFRDFDFVIEDHGIPTLSGTVEWDDGCFNPFGYQVNVAFLMRLLGAVGVSSLNALHGKSAWITLDNASSMCPTLVSVEPLHKKDGTPFIVTEWQEWSDTNCNHSAYEQRTGSKK